MSPIEILLAIVLGLAVNECSDVSPWLARKLMRLSARLRYVDLERRRIRSDEWVALVDERPGKLLKLLTGIGFLLAAVGVSARRVANKWMRRVTRSAATDRSSVGFAAAAATIGSNVDELAHAAEQVRATIQGLDASAGAVVTVRGPWGSGKTSVVRVALDSMTEAQIVDFNPWLHWDEKSPVHVASALPDCLRGSARRLRRVAAAFEKYLDLCAVEPRKFRCFSLSIARSVRQIKRALQTLPRPLIVVVDDIDRMPLEKVGELFNFVERTAHLPQLIYVMSFDRRVIELVVNDPRTPKRRRRLQQFVFDLTCTHRRRPNTAA